MKGGVVEGIRFECGSASPVIETQEGSLEIRGSSLTRCGMPGLDVSGIAQVVLRPSNLTDYCVGQAVPMGPVLHHVFRSRSQGATSTQTALSTRRKSRDYCGGLPCSSESPLSMFWSVWRGFGASPAPVSNAMMRHPNRWQLALASVAHRARHRRRA
jgi:hypothetical protein